MTTFVGKRGIDTYTAIVLKSSLKLYAQTGLKPNRAWTPTAMLRKAGEITGERFKRGEYARAVLALDNWIKVNGTTGR